MRPYFPAFAFAALSCLLAISTTMAAPDRGEIAVVFPLLTDESTSWSIVRASGAKVVGPTHFGNVVVAYAPDLAARNRMQRLGALFFLAAKGLCSTPAQQVSDDT